jgi:hypothetical protein
VDQGTEHKALDFLYNLQGRQEQSKETCKSEQITELKRFGVGRESFTVQNVHESVFGVGLSV